RVARLGLTFVQLELIAPDEEDVSGLEIGHARAATVDVDLVVAAHDANRIVGRLANELRVGGRDRRIGQHDVVALGPADGDDGEPEEEVSLLLRAGIAGSYEHAWLPK
ncbi:hypothetical protein RZS08_36775, partial [Arthrospira platensis SPKY1]|nr:hypothetical protein [Arthrospira platensis SPKY1]